MPVNLPNPQSIEDRPAAGAPSQLFIPRAWLEGGMAILNASGGVLEINKPLCHWLEKPVTDLIGESFWDILAKISPDWNEALSQASRSAAPFAHMDLNLPARDGQAAQWFNMEVARTPQCSLSG